MEIRGNTRARNEGEKVTVFESQNAENPRGRNSDVAERVKERSGEAEGRNVTGRSPGERSGRARSASRRRCPYLEGGSNRNIGNLRKYTLLFPLENSACMCFDIHNLIGWQKIGGDAPAFPPATPLRPPPPALTAPPRSPRDPFEPVS